MSKVLAIGILVSGFILTTIGTIHLLRWCLNSWKHKGEEGDMHYECKYCGRVIFRKEKKCRICGHKMTPIKETTNG